MDKNLNNNTASNYSFGEHYLPNQNQAETALGQNFNDQYSEEEASSENKNICFYLSPLYSLFKDEEGSSFVIDKKQLRTLSDVLRYVSKQLIKEYKRTWNN